MSFIDILDISISEYFVTASSIAIVLLFLLKHFKVITIGLILVNLYVLQCVRLPLLTRSSYNDVSCRSRYSVIAATTESSKCVYT